MAISKLDKDEVLVLVSRQVIQDAIDHLMHVPICSRGGEGPETRVTAGDALEALRRSLSGTVADDGVRVTWHGDMMKPVLWIRGKESKWTPLGEVLEETGWVRVGRMT